MSPSERVFGIPELASIIYRFSSRQDCARLLRVCHFCFFSARTIVWKNVPGAIYLLRLIPGILDNNYSPNILSATVELTRFLLYAPFVEKLEISRTTYRKYRLQGTWRLLSHLVRPPALLPNLRCLTYTHPFPGPLEESQLDWLQIFLGPSVRHVKISIHSRWLIWQNISSASKLLHAVSAQCPRLESLFIHPGEPVPGSAHHDEDGWSRPEVVVFKDDENMIHKRMGTLHNLRSLSTSPVILEPETFHTISRLPCLETLAIESTGNGGPLWGDYSLSDDSFPALRTLRLIHLDPRNTERLCSLEPLVQRLTHASIIFNDCGDDVIVWDYHGSRSDIIRSFVTRCLELTELCVKMGENNPGMGMCHRTLDMFRLLPIRRFDVDLVDSELGVTLAEMLDAFPCVEVLRLTRTPVDHQFLRHAAAKLPRLRNLELHTIEFEEFDASPSSDEFVKPPNQSQLPLCIGGQFYLDHCSHDDVARYLYALWPNVTIKNPWEGLPLRSGLPEFPRRINRILSELKQAAE